MNMLEAQVGCLPGLTHSFGGLSPDNRAAIENRFQNSYPRAAALQNLNLMKKIADLGIPQVVLPPHERPNLVLLRSLGFSGTDWSVMAAAMRHNVDLVVSTCSSSFMWTANAATVAPSIDTADGKLHIVPANLAANLHRAAEAEFTASLLKKVFGGPSFVHDAPLPTHSCFGDEGAANHTRLGTREQPGVHLFTYSFAPGNDRPPFVGRQSLHASEAVARLLRLPFESCVFARQNPSTIAAGAFHLDVIAVGNESLLLIHQDALVDQPKVLDQLRVCLRDALQVVVIPREMLSVEDAIKSYIFNSQIVTTPTGTVMIAPEQSRQIEASSRTLSELQLGGLIRTVLFQPLAESMRGGGGPACLRLRMPLNRAEFEQIYDACLLTNDLYVTLQDWIKRFYPERLSISDLGDPQLLAHNMQALNEVSRILKLENIYNFQHL